MQKVKQNFFESDLCLYKLVCRFCRKSQEYRNALSIQYLLPKVDFECPVCLSEDDFKDTNAPSTEELMNLIVNPPQKTQAQTKIARLNICEKCSKFLTKRQICTICNCSLPLSNRLIDGKCPLNKW